MRVHFVENNDIIVAFFPDSLRFFKIDNNFKALIDVYVNGADRNYILNEFSHIENLESTLTLLDSLKNTSFEFEPIDRNELSKLAINVSNSCNLNCEYCYAEGGNYGAKNENMDIHTVKTTLDRFYSEYKKIKDILIFGGEPLLNIPAIKYICEYIHKKFKDNKSDTPILNIVTNGTIISDEIINLINRYKINITVSFDGIPDTNDMTRVFKDGSPTSDIIINTMKVLREKTTTFDTIEITYNRNHEIKNVTITDIYWYLRDVLGEISIQIVPVCGDRNPELVLKSRDGFINIIDDLNNEFIWGEIKGYGCKERIIAALSEKTPSIFMCSAGFNTIAVNTKGDIFACYMLVNQSKFKIGNIFNFDRHSFRSEVDKYMSFSKLRSGICKDCFNNTLCTETCMGVNYFDTGNEYNPGSKNCEMFKALTEKIILNSAIMQD